MSEAAQTATSGGRTILVPAILTNSLRVVLNTFRSDIIRLRATGSIGSTNQTLIDELREYGVVRKQEESHRIDLDYTQLQNADAEEPSNPIDADARKTICKHLDAVLDPPNGDVKPDLSVQSLTIRVTDERLKTVTPAQTDEFDLRFSADKAEKPVRDQLRRLNNDRGLYSELGFKLHNLNLHSVIETATKYMGQTDGRYFSWSGPGDVRLKSRKKLAIRINEHVLPEEYGTLKPYQVTEDMDTQIVESEFEPPQPTLQDRIDDGGDA